MGGGAIVENDISAEGEKDTFFTSYGQKDYEIKFIIGDRIEIVSADYTERINAPPLPEVL